MTTNGLMSKHPLVVKIALIIISNGSMYLPMKLTIEDRYVCCVDKRSKVVAAPNKLAAIRLTDMVYQHLQFLSSSVIWSRLRRDQAS